MESFANITEYDYDIIVDLMFETGANMNQCIEAHTMCEDFILSLIYINLKYNRGTMCKMDEHGNKRLLTDDDYLKEAKRRVF